MEVPGVVVSIVQFVAVNAMVFGGVVPYIPQLLQIRRTRSVEGFSTWVCFALLMANMLRIYFWFGHPFELPLLAQSILMVAAMMVLLRECVHASRYEGSAVSHPIRLQGPFAFDSTTFWRWTVFADYVLAVLTISTTLGLATYVLLDVSVFVELLGFLAVFVEAVLGAPQWYRNYTQRSTRGMSVTMVAMWLSGDCFKTVYFILRGAPLQFPLCGCLQIGVDIAILWQVFVYRNNR